MELKYLNTFKTILETGSFQKAAERLNYAQSTITLQMQILEQELSECPCPKPYWLTGCSPY